MQRFRVQGLGVEGVGLARYFEGLTSSVIIFCIALLIDHRLISQARSTQLSD